MRIVTSVHLAGLRYTAWSLVGVGAIALAGPAQAQSVGIGTTKGGATAQVTAAIAKVVSAHAGLQMRPQPYANTSQYIPVVNTGKLEFAASNIFQLTFAIRAANLNVRTAGWNFVQVPNFPRMWDGFKRGTLDAAIAAVGSKPTRDMKAAQGALRILQINDDRDSVARMRRHLPQSYVISMKTNPKLPGVNRDVKIMAFDYTLWAHKDVKADIVYRIARSMHDRAADLRAAAPLWRSFKEAGMAKNVGIEYHPGAIRFYREKDMWRQ